MIVFCAVCVLLVRFLCVSPSQPENWPHLRADKQEGFLPTLASVPSQPGLVTRSATGAEAAAVRIAAATAASEGDGDPLRRTNAEQGFGGTNSNIDSSIAIPARVSSSSASSGQRKNKKGGSEGDQRGGKGKGGAGGRGEQRLSPV